MSRLSLNRIPSWFKPAVIEPEVNKHKHSNDEDSDPGEEADIENNTDMMMRVVPRCHQI